jgi:tripeptide aminopeptidase
VDVTIVDSYYNMKEKVAPHIHLVDNAKLAMQRAGVTPHVCPIRGGTDGARLSYEGLPCPNLFTGGYNFHGRYEYIPLEDMYKAYEVALNLVDIYKDR